MRSRKVNENPSVRPNSHSDDTRGDSANDEADEFETQPDGEENDVDATDLLDADDECWDVFILDDDGDPLPDYGDFWFPD